MTHPDHILPQPARMTHSDHILSQLARMTHPDHTLPQPTQMTHPDHVLPQPAQITHPHYINTNEITGKLTRENLISSRVKISPLLWLHNRSLLSHQKTIKGKWFGSSLVFT